MDSFYIDDWSQCHDGEIVIEDTYPQVYKIFTNKRGQRYIKQVGWQLAQLADRPLDQEERILDFEPNCPWDQPWICMRGHELKKFAYGVKKND